jgi:serine/threonine-protein kinase
VQDLLRKATAKRASERHKTALAFRDAVEDTLGPLASPAQLAELLEHHFPAQDSPRAARKQVLEAALAAHARAWAQTPKESEAPTIPLSQRQLMELEAKPRNWRAAMPLVFGFVVASALAVAFWYQTRTATPRPVLYGPVTPATNGKSPGPVVSATTLAGGPAPAAPAAAPSTASPPAAAAAPAPGPSAAPPAPAPAPTPVAAAPVTPPVPAPAAKPASDFLTTGIDLSTDPSVEATLDGKKYGRTPLVIPATPGRHVLGLTDKSKGISQTRAVTVGKEGVTPLRFSVGRGTLSVRAPRGASVFVDGRAVGASPVEDLHLFEGTHHLKVTLGDAVWQQNFTLRSEQSLRYDVELKPTNGG